ncbi:hypothetical protein [Nocardia asiatica]|uniref:hypothetical protein n=1 Tax=Nocardia asiatica TaxID=209252 RepID=UPI002453CEF9|nr:hypothetical protein [Nocardia asiatica]
MPKNSSARRRRRARRIAAEEGVKYREALRRGDERAAQTRTESWLPPVKIEIDGVMRYVRHDDATELGDDELADPAGADVVAAADVLLRQARALQSARLRPVTAVGADGQPQRVVQCVERERFSETVRAVRADVERVREDADIAFVEWTTVHLAQSVDSRLSGLRRITGGALRDRIDAAVAASEYLYMVCEAVHSRGCLLGAGEDRHRRRWGYSPCGGGDVRVRVRVRVFDDDTIVTVPGCPRHAAEEIVYWDYEVEDGMVGVDVLGGTDEDLDLIYDLADEVRRERDRLRRAHAQNPAGVRTLPQPPWMRRQDW